MTDRSVIIPGGRKGFPLEGSELELILKSGGRRIGLYAELGRYFAPDGSLNEPAFRTFVSDSLRARLDAEEGSAEQAGRWLSTYLADVLAYLDSKGMHAATLRLFEVAVDESAKLGVTAIMVDPRLLQELLTMAAQKGPAIPVRRHAPDEKRKRILDCALKIITERGFHQITMDEVAAESGVAKGTVYRYFKSKEDLLDQLLVTTSQMIVERFSKSFTGEQNVIDEIQCFIEDWLQFIEENHDLYRLIQAEGILPHSGRRAKFYEYLMSNFPMAKERIVAMNAAGELKMVSFSTVAYGMLGFIDGVVNKWFRSGMSYPLRDETPVILEVLINGFAKERGRPRVYFQPPEDQPDPPPAP